MLARTPLRSAIHMAKLCVFAAACAVLAPAATHANGVVPAIIYGIDNNNDIYEIDPVAKTSVLALVQPAGGQSNSLAFDTVRNQLFFIDPDNKLRYWLQGSGSMGISVAGSPSIATDPNNASYYDNSYWFFEFNSNQLHRWSMTYSGTGSAAVPSVSGTQVFSIGGMDLPPVGSANNTNTFGDIAINPNTGILYASTSRGRFYSVNLGTNTFTELAASLGNDNTVGLQLAFNTDYSILYGHSYETGLWYEVSLTDGARTPITDFSTTPFGGKGFRDLGGSAVAAVPEPSSVALACVGAGGLAWRLMRRRRQAA